MIDQINAVRLQFLRKVLPLTKEDDELIEFARAIANAIGDISFDEAVTAFNKAVAEKTDD